MTTRMIVLLGLLVILGTSSYFLVAKIARGTHQLSIEAEDRAPIPAAPFSAATAPQTRHDHREVATAHPTTPNAEAHSELIPARPEHRAAFRVFVKRGFLPKSLQLSPRDWDELFELYKDTELPLERKKTEIKTVADAIVKSRLARGDYEAIPIRNRSVPPQVLKANVVGQLVHAVSSSEPGGDPTEMKIVRVNPGDNVEVDRLRREERDLFVAQKLTVEDFKERKGVR
jgi:hypothetical protein